jgi:hypothetical protein
MQCTVKHVQKSSAHYYACLAALCYSVTIAVNLLKERVMQNINFERQYIEIIAATSKTIAAEMEKVRSMILEGDTTTLAGCAENIEFLLHLQHALIDYAVTANLEQLQKQFKNIDPATNALKRYLQYDKFYFESTNFYKKQNTVL